MEGETNMYVKYPIIITHNGLPFDVLKSAVQKYIRRGFTYNALWCTREAFYFRVIKDYGSAEKGVLTNFINRLKVILIEDVSFRECKAALYVVRCIDEYENSDRLDLEVLYKAVQVLAWSSKLRIANHAKAYYNSFSFKGYDSIEVTLREMESAFNDKDFKKVVKLTIVLCKIWDKKNKKKALDSFWKLLERQVKNENMAVEYLKWRRKFFENRPFFKEQDLLLVSSAILAVYCRNDNINLNPCNFNEPCPYFIQTHSFPSDQLNHPEYVYDIHTKIGRMNNKTQEDFIREGSIVYNEDEEMKVQEWFEAYISNLSSTKGNVYANH